MSYFLITWDYTVDDRFDAKRRATESMLTQHGRKVATTTWIVRIAEGTAHTLRARLTADIEQEGQCTLSSQDTFVVIQVALNDAGQPDVSTKRDTELEKFLHVPDFRF